MYHDSGAKLYLYISAANVYASNMENDNRDTAPDPWKTPLPEDKSSEDATYTQLQQSVPTPPQPPSVPDASTILDIPDGEAPKSLFERSRLLVWALAAYILNFSALLLAYSTEDYGFASTMSTFTFYGGILGALLLGAGMVQLTLSSINQHRGSINSMVKIGILLLALSPILGLLTLVPGIIVFLIGLKKPPEENDDPTPISSGKKAFLAICTFLGGGIVGLAISFIIAMMTSQRACELSSSKCY